MIVLLTSPGGHPPGTEAMFYTTRKSVQRHAGWADHVLLVIDFSNAFDTDDGLRSSLKCCSACRACLLGQSGDLFPESPLSSQVGRAQRDLQAASCLLWSLPYRLAAFHRGGLLGWCAHGQQISRQCCSWENPGGFSGAAAKEVYQSANNFHWTPKKSINSSRKFLIQICAIMRVTFSGFILIKEQIIFILVSRIVFTVRIQPRCWVVCLLLLSKFWWTGKKTSAIGPKIEKIAAKTSATGSQNNPACVTTFVAERVLGPGSGQELGVPKGPAGGGVASRVSGSLLPSSCKRLTALLKCCNVGAKPRTDATGLEHTMQQYQTHWRRRNKVFDQRPGLLWWLVRPWLHPKSWRRFLGWRGCCLGRKLDPRLHKVLPPVLLCTTILPQCRSQY